MKKKKKPSLTDYLTADDESVGQNSQAVHSDAGSRATFAESSRESAEKKRIRAQKRAKRREKKAERRRLRAIRRHENAVLYSPEKMKGFPLSVAIGYLFRFFSIAFSIFGIMVLLADSFLSTELNYGWLLLYSMVMVTAFSLIFIGRKLILAGAGLFAGTIGFLTLLWGSPAALYAGGLIRVINQSMDRLRDAGFAAAEQLSMPNLGSLTASEPDKAYLYGGLFLIITLLALAFSAFSAKRTRLFPMLLVGGGLCVVCFTYNLCRTNFGIACVLAGLCSAIVLSTYDRIYAEHKKSRKSRGYSGFSAALAGLLAFAVLAAPAAKIEDPWRTIDFISRPMSDLRMIVTTILTGGNPELNVMNTLKNKRDNSLKSVEFDEIPLFTVSSYQSRQNIYLRSWIGDDYDYNSDAWNILSDDEYKQMVRSISGASSTFTGDQANYLLAYLFNNWLAADSLPADRTTGSSDQGYYFSYVDIEYTGNTGQLYVLPSSFIPSLGLYQYGSRTARYGSSFDLYSDGIYRSSWTNLRKQYTAGALIPTYQDPDFGAQADELAAAYAALVRFFGGSGLLNMSEEDITAAYNRTLADAGVRTSLQAPLRNYLTALENDSWRSWRKQTFDVVGGYADYVKSHYLSYPADSEGLAKISAEIRPDFDKAATTYDKIMTVVNYMILNYEYTTTPTAPQGRYSSDLDAFLLETKDGYCVQFASAAALLLRSFGIPARYVQGYIASDSRDAEDAEGNKIYERTVLDSDAHAWIEVWMDGLGWRTFEVTPAYYQALYYIPTSLPGDNDSTQHNPIVDVVEQVTSRPATSETRPTTRPEETTEPVTEEPEDPGEEEGKVFDPTALFILLGGVICAGGIALLVLWRIRKARKIAAGRRYFIERAIYGTFEDQADLDLVSGTLVDGIYAIMKIIGKVPRQGETPCEFANRVDRPKKPENKTEEKAVRRQLLWAHTFTEVTFILEKREFSGQIDRDELATLGEFLESIEKVEYPALPFMKKLYHRYIRCSI